MRPRPIRTGDVILATFPHSVPYGHEQAGKRPAIVVGLPQKLGTPRFPMLLVVPLTTQIGHWATQNPKLYPIIQAGTAGLARESVALIDQLRGIDHSRVDRYISSLNREDVSLIQQLIMYMFK